MSPSRFKKTVLKIGRIFLLAIFFIPQFYLLISGETIPGKFLRNKNNSVGTGSSLTRYSTYETYVYGYKVDENNFTIEASDFYINNFKDVKIIYNPHYPKHAAIKSASGLFLMRTLMFVCGFFVLKTLVSLFLKEKKNGVSKSR